MACTASITAVSYTHLDVYKRQEFITRCKAGLLDCLMELEKQVTVQEKVVCIVHGGTIMALFDSYGQGSYFDYQCRCCLLYTSRCV